MSEAQFKGIYSEEFQPQSTLLQHYIVSFWHLKTELPEGMVLSSRDVPNGNIQLIFNLGDAFTGEKQSGASRALRQPILRGPQRSFNLVHKTGHINLFGLTFSPFGLADFIMQPVSDFTDTIQPLEEIFPSIAILPVHTLSVKERIACIENLLLQSLQPKSHTAAVATLIGKINQSKGTLPLKDIELPFKISLKHLERIFKATTGLTPKQYAQQVRINHIIHDIHQGEEDLLQLATTYNFCDVAHLSKDFKTFTGLTPGKFNRHTITFNHSYTAM